MSSVKHYPQLSAYMPEKGVTALCEVDSINIALANVLVGLSYSQPQENKTVIIDNAPENIIALPITDLDVEDENARQFILIDEILQKIQSWLPLNNSVGLAITGDVSKTLIKLIGQQCAIDFPVIISEPTTELTLTAFESCIAEQAPEEWLWISLHAGCARKRMQAQGTNIATNVTSECPIPADAAVAILLSKPQNGNANPQIMAITEPNTDDPLLKPSKALQTLLENVPDAENSVLIHSMANTPEGNIELYRLEQYLNSKREPSDDSAPWLSVEPNRYNLASVHGDVGVCQLPLMMLIQKTWQQAMPLVTLATEHNTRFVWQTTANT